MMSLIERSEYDDDVSMLMMFLIERSEYDDDVSVILFICFCHENEMKY